MQHQTNDNCVQMPYESWKSAIPPRSLHCPPSCLIFMTRDTGGLCVCVCVHVWTLLPFTQKSTPNTISLSYSTTTMFHPPSLYMTSMTYDF